MSHKLISHSPDLKKLRDEGCGLEIKGGYLLVHGVPYVNSQKAIVHGTLVCKLELANDKTVKPGDHVAYFIGEHPCCCDGTVLKGVVNANKKQDLGNGVNIDLTFSCKPPHPGYADYYEKVTTYIKILSSHAQAIDPSVKAQSFNVAESTDTDDVFHYIDTNSSRADINAISAKLENLKIAIVGLGGTGSYILDFVVKTGVKEIHVFDEDILLQHNAFRIPGAVSGEELGKKPRKVSYHCDVYSRLRKRIFPHDYNLVFANVGELSGIDFVFICVDSGDAKKVIIDKLMTDGVPFIDVGVGVHSVDGSLTGGVRVTTCTKEKHDHIATTVSFSGGEDNDYVQNIQIAELNALNAALAVIKWKKLYGFYHDLEKEYNSIYEINLNKIIADGLVA